MPRRKRCSSPFELMDDDYDDTSSQSSRNGNPPIQRNAANARERARMRVLSSAFGRLKTKLPNIPADTKLSKLDTLRLATMYIKQLKTVVEGGPASPTSTNGETVEGSVNSSPTNCYINLHSGAQSMNWPFGFHHHLTNSASGRSTSSSSLLNSSNWCQNDIAELKQIRYENENYHHHHEAEQQQLQQQQQNPSYNQQHHTTTSQQITHNTHENHWYSDTPSPELDTSSTSNCLCLENSLHLNHQQQSQQQHHLPHLQPATTHSSTFHLQHNFQNHHQQQHHQQHQQPQHLQHNFVNASNFQSTSIR